MANKILSTPPAAWEYLGTVDVAVSSTAGDIAGAITAAAFSVDDSDLVELRLNDQQMASADRIMVGTDNPNVAFLPVRGDASAYVSIVCYGADIPELRMKTGTGAAICAVYRYKSNA